MVTTKSSLLNQLAALALGLGAPGLVYAQAAPAGDSETLQEIVITAEKREST